MRQWNRYYINYYTTETNNHAQNAKDSTQITIIISIVSIAIVGLIVAPMLSRIQDMQYRALNLFIDLPYDKINEIF